MLTDAALTAADGRRSRSCARILKYQQSDTDKDPSTVRHLEKVLKTAPVVVLTTMGVHRAHFAMTTHTHITHNVETSPGAGN